MIRLITLVYALALTWLVYYLAPHENPGWHWDCFLLGLVMGHRAFEEGKEIEAAWRGRIQL